MRTQWLSLCLVAAVPFLTACSSDSATAPSYENISGTYSGAVVGVSQGVQLTGTFSITVNQSGGALSGSTAMVGTLDDGFDQVAVQGSGALSGTIASGNNPSVTVTVSSGFCPNYTATYSGAYDGTNRLITLTGPIDILNQTCAVVLRYPTTILLRR